MNVSRRVSALAAIALGLALSACEKPESVSGPAPAVVPATETKPAAPAALPGLAFDGSQAISRRLEGELASYAVRSRVKAATASADPAEFGETTPPMPFVVGGVWSSQIGSRLSVNSQVIPDILAPTDVVVINIAGVGLSVYANGELVGTTDAVDPATSVRVGVGYKTRTFSGLVEFFEVLDLTGATAMPTLQELAAYPVAYTLDAADLRPIAAE